MGREGKGKEGRKEERERERAEIEKIDAEHSVRPLNVASPAVSRVLGAGAC